MGHKYLQKKINFFDGEKRARKFYLNWQAFVEEAIYRKKKRRVTQQRLALIAQVSTPTISKFESGSEDIELSSVLCILHAVGMADKRMLMFLMMNINLILIGTLRCFVLLGDDRVYSIVITGDFGCY